MANDVPLVTVFMAAYNADKHIEESIRSVLSQTFSDFELLIVNDGSLDNTAATVTAINDPRIRLIKNNKNQGLLYTRNLMLTEARGQFIAVLDSDDVAIANRLEIQLEEFKKRPALALLGSPAIIIDTEGNETGNYIDVPSGVDKIKCNILFYNTFVHSSVMIKKDAFLHIGGYQNYPLAEDYDLMIRLSYDYEIDNLTSPIVKYRIHGNNISNAQEDYLKVNLREIKKEQLRKMDIECKDDYIDKLLLHPSKTDLSLQSYADFASLLVTQNKKKSIYPKTDFEKLIFDLWYEAILYRPNRNAFLLLFKRPIFAWKYVQAKQIRRVFRLAIKAFFKGK